MSPRVTIGLPFYNPGRWFLPALQSVFAQTFVDWEAILVDDGSTDSSLVLAQQIRDPRVRVVSDGVNLGLSDRLNQITELAQGEYLARMDADDMLHPERITRQVAYLDEHSQTDVVGSAAVIVDREGCLTGVRGTGPLATRPREVLAHGVFIHPTIMGRATWFRANPYNRAYLRAEDRELWVRTFAFSHFAEIDDPLYFYREGPEVNLSAYLQSCRTHRKILRRYGPSLVGWPNTVFLVVESLAKTWAYRFATTLDLQSYLVRGRSGAVGERMKGAYAQQLAIIPTIPIPGLNSLDCIGLEEADKGI